MPPMRIHFCGVRGSTSAAGIDFVRYGGHTSCLALAHDGAGEPTLMLDAGTGLQVASSPLCPSGCTVVTGNTVYRKHIMGLYIPSGTTGLHTYLAAVAGR